MFSYLFVSGNAFDLTSLEVESRYKNNSSEKMPLGVVITLENELSDPKSVINDFGGVVKIAQKLTGEVLENNVADFICDYLAQKSVGRATFGIGGEIALPKANKLIAEVKNKLATKQVKARFLLARPGQTSLSSVVIEKQRVSEFLLVRKSGGYSIFLTLAVQDYEDWGKKDYGRPKAEGHLGMLPPKVAKMMVNIAHDHLPNQNPLVLLDPFCGVGTICAEALLSGIEVIGCDSDSLQIERTSKNLEWLCLNYPKINSSYKLFVAKAEKVSEAISPGVNLIVTEPYLGPNIQDRELGETVKVDLENLYLHCLASWKQLFAGKPGIVGIILPSFFWKGHLDSRLVKNVIDKAQVLGYSLVSKPCEYYRPQAYVRRNICFFKI